ncbi:hypothetical protein AJ80_03728 [Polytolypa hystricis UAMH7299]|uniref:HNH nuclease domain-containing protein n=1 Tax=Polytolypa hystricis (strain UAMH7299) TaxID=1447883 RepID=A0A2B7YGN5_POLH7|nr:hypothetical protein AJ80_03728 [Polytolypa hystricis UAMH7299]
MLTLRSSLLLFAFILVSLSSVAQSFRFQRHSVDSADFSGSIQKRAPKEHNPLPCPPSDKKPKFSAIRDDGASVGVLPYTAEIIKQGNEAQASGSKLKPRSTVENEASIKQPKGEKLSKRIQNLLRDLYNEAEVKVATDSSAGIVFNANRNIEDQIVATRDLSGCTVVVVASPFACLMLHVWERRAEDNAEWLLNPSGPAQQAQDEEFGRKGQELLGILLAQSGGSIVDGYGRWFPADSTTVHVVAPATNPEYNDRPDLFNPWYTLLPTNPMGLIYQRGAETLQAMASEVVIPGRMFTQGNIRSYRRRYSNDPNHGTDDTEYVILKPTIMPNKEVWLVMLYDNHKAEPIVRIA